MTDNPITSEQEMPNTQCNTSQLSAKDVFLIKQNVRQYMRDKEAFREEWLCRFKANPNILINCLLDLANPNVDYEVKHQYRTLLNSVFINPTGEELFPNNLDFKGSKDD